MKLNSLIPELYCSHFENSLMFYKDILGFKVLYSRAQERFAFLERDGAQLMIEQTVQPERQWVKGELQHPFGRGLNLQIMTKDVKVLYQQCTSASAEIFLPLEEKWYPVENKQIGNWQFIVLDPDGYLLRFSQSLGVRDL
jgi:catechol 2,3-dioxygenase-like lactoylglutathione lyase family enzyme